MRIIRVGIAVIVFSCTNTHTIPCNSKLLSHDEAHAIGKLVWRNECKGTVEGLTSWNAGEDFASLGIGHFIWYPTGKTGPFQESFPALLSFLKRKKIALPAWLTPETGCPWESREAFIAGIDSKRMIELRTLLANTISYQVMFMVQRLDEALAKLVQASPENKEVIEKKFRILASHSAGKYALLDYLNFKGEGLKPAESYQGHRWGLLQVLEHMPLVHEPEHALEQFAHAAKKVLEQRVAHAPRDESRWLPGWHNRINTYRSTALTAQK